MAVSYNSYYTNVKQSIWVLAKLEQAALGVVHAWEIDGKLVKVEQNLRRAIMSDVADE